MRSGVRDPASALSPQGPPCRTGAPAISAPPEIQALAIEHGLLPWARALNPKFSDDRRLLFAALDIVWRPPDPAFAIAGLEEALVAFSPGFARHECRGAAAYHVFRRSRPGPRVSGDDRRPLEGPLALAHLIEHAVIDFQCLITEETTCSGATAARRDPPDRFDLIIECRDFAVGRCCLVLAIGWLTSIVCGHRLGPAERIVLAVAGAAHHRRGRGLRAPLLARMLRAGEDEVRRAIGVLVEAGYLIEARGAAGPRGDPGYRLEPGRS